MSNPDPIGLVRTDPKPPGLRRKILFGLLAIAGVILLALAAVQALEHLKP